MSLVSVATESTRAETVACKFGELDDQHSRENEGSSKSATTHLCDCEIMIRPEEW